MIEWLQRAVARASDRRDQIGERLALTLVELLGGAGGGTTGTTGTTGGTGRTGGLPQVVLDDEQAGNGELGLVIRAHVAIATYLRDGPATGVPALRGALADTHIGRNENVEAVLRCFLAHANLLEGSSGQLNRELRRVSDLGSGSSTPTITGALRDGILGTWQAATGDRNGAAATFSSSTNRCRHDPRAAALLSAFEAEASISDEGVGGPDGRHDPWPGSGRPAAEWIGEMARRGQARVIASRGQPGEAIELLDGIEPTTFQGAVTTVLLARLLIGQGNQARATAALGPAVEVLDRAGANRAAVEALMLLGSVAAAEVERSDAYARALSLSTSDPLFEACWATRPPMNVRVIGQKALAVGNEPLDLGDRAEQLFISVLVSGEAGAHWETVAAWLWPDEADMAKLKSRVSSTTNLCRKALGSEAWRLVREGPILKVHRRSLHLDLDDESALAGMGSLPDSAREPLLPGWAQLEWVQDAEQARSERMP